MKGLYLVINFLKSNVRNQHQLTEQVADVDSDILTRNFHSINT